MLTTSGALQSRPSRTEQKAVLCTSGSWLCLFCWETTTRGDRTVMKGEFRSTIKAAVRGPKNRELKVGAVFFL